MVIYDTRKKALVQEFGENGCLTENSWLRATFEDVNDQFRIYTDDMEWMYKNPTECVEGTTTPEETTSGSGVIINAGGLKANVLIGNVIKGTTDSIIELVPGAYMVTIVKTGYKSLDLPFSVVKERYTEKYVTLVPDAQDIEIITPTSGPNIKPTMRNKNPSPIKPGYDNWFGWEFKNHGDKKWSGIVGVRITSYNVETGEQESLYEYLGDSAIHQSVAAGEIKYLWVKAPVPPDFVVTENVEIKALLTKT
jgi:hypothetical protein